MPACLRGYIISSGVNFQIFNYSFYGVLKIFHMLIADNENCFFVYIKIMC